MKQCHGCGNTYDKCFEIIKDDKSYFFDSFECAINKLAPICPKCECKVIGHGVEADAIYCCAHCAKSKGVSGIKDREKVI